MNFEQLILQEGFGAVNFDLWILLVKYEIPSIFISSKVIPESNFLKQQFLCYDDDQREQFVFIVAPAMYIRYKNHDRLCANLNLLLSGHVEQQVSNIIDQLPNDLNFELKKYWT